MKRTHDETVYTSSTAHLSVQHSRTLNRKYVKKPEIEPKIAENDTSTQTPTKNSQPKIIKINTDSQKNDPKPSTTSETTAQKTNASPSANSKIESKTPEDEDSIIPKPDSHSQKEPKAQKQSKAQELKNEAIKRAISTMAIPEQTQPKQQNQTKTKAKTAKVNKTKKRQKSNGGVKHIALAFVCASICVAAIVFFVNLNMTDISTQISAMQKGINAVTPAYVPRDYNSSNVLAEEGKITITYSGPKDAKFEIIEEKTSWNEQALLNNYVKQEYGDDYSTTREKGLTIYMTKKESVWINGGVKFTLKNTTGSLSKKQMSNIIASLS